MVNSQFLEKVGIKIKCRIFLYLSWTISSQTKFWSAKDGFNVHFGDLKTEIRKKRLWKKVLLIVQSQDIQYAIAPLWYCVYRIRAVTLFSLYATCITSLFCAGCLCRNKDDILQEHLRVHNQGPGNQQQQTHDQCSGAILTRLQLVKIPAPAPALLFAK